MAIKTEILAFRMSVEEKNILEAMAKENDIPVSQIIRAAIRKYIQEVNKDAK